MTRTISSATAARWLGRAFAAFMAASALAVLPGCGAHTTTPRASGAAPDITMQSLDGKLWSLSDHRGKVVLVNVWATWCPPCQAETPGIVKLAKAYGPKGVDFVGISVDQDQDGPKVVRQFVQQYGIPYPILMPSKDHPLNIDASAIPVTLIINRQGQISDQFVGSQSEETFEQALNKALGS